MLSSRRLDHSLARRIAALCLMPRPRRLLAVPRHPRRRPRPPPKGCANHRARRAAAGPERAERRGEAPGERAALESGTTRGSWRRRGRRSSGWRSCSARRDFSAQSPPWRHVGVGGHAPPDLAGLRSLTPRAHAALLDLDPDGHGRGPGCEVWSLGDRRASRRSRTSSLARRAGRRHDRRGRASARRDASARVAPALKAARTAGYRRFLWLFVRGH